MRIPKKISLLLASALLLAIGTSACYAPNTAWKPRKSNAIRKQTKPKRDKPLRPLTFWK